jgi:hypothetical protein
MIEWLRGRLRDAFHALQLFERAYRALTRIDLFGSVPFNMFVISSGMIPSEAFCYEVELST